MTDTTLVFEEVAAEVGGRRVLDGVSLTLAPSELVALIGPNGAGKTTLLRTGVGLLSPHAGSVRLAGRAPHTLPAADRARMLAYLPQQRPLAWPLRVRDLVALGRYAHGGPLGALQAADAAAVARALATCGLEALADRRADALSGGELARAHVARALAAETRILLADEPAAFLDPRHAWRALEAIRAYCRAGGAALVTLHDVALAAAFADRIVLLAEGRVVADGPASAVVTSERLAAVYGVRASVEQDGQGLMVAVRGMA